MPFEAVVMALCERLHCLPSELFREDMGYIMRGLDLVDLYRELKDLQRGKPATRRVADALILEAESG